MANEAKHTPGPWTVAYSHADGARWVETVAIDQSYAGNIANVESIEGDPEMTKANASLIAAAPELLRELEAADIIIEQARRALLAAHADRSFTLRAKARRAAIAKAVQP